MHELPVTWAGIVILRDHEAPVELGFLTLSNRWRRKNVSECYLRHSSAKPISLVRGSLSLLTAPHRRIAAASLATQHCLQDLRKSAT